MAMLQTFPNALAHEIACEPNNCDVAAITADPLLFMVAMLIVGIVPFQLSVGLPANSMV
jgi:hypothetical protein